MYRIKIARYDGKLFETKFDTMEKLETWRNNHIANDTWGKKERHIEDRSDYDTRLIIKRYQEIDEPSLQVKNMVHLKSEYEITIEDITEEINAANKKKDKEKKIKGKREQIEAGLDIISYMALLNDEKNLSSNQKDQILFDEKIQLIAKYLQFGRLGRARILIDNFNEDGILITKSDKVAILEYLDERIK